MVAVEPSDPLPVVLDLDFAVHAFAFDNREAMRVNDQMIDLRSVIICFEANAVEDEYVGIVAKMPLKVEGHLLFSGTPKLGKLILGMKWIEFLVNHGSCSYSFAMTAILTPCG